MFSSNQTSICGTIDFCIVNEHKMISDGYKVSLGAELVKDIKDPIQDSTLCPCDKLLLYFLYIQALNLLHNQLF